MRRFKLIKEYPGSGDLGDIAKLYENHHYVVPHPKKYCDGLAVPKGDIENQPEYWEEILEVFWFVHDPTQLNRQGNDIGTQYRSEVFYHDDIQKGIAEHYKAKLTEENVWDKPIVTLITPLNNFYRAEEYHHNYFELNPGNAYCQSIVRPKVEKFKSVFAEKLK